MSFTKHAVTCTIQYNNEIAGNFIRIPPSLADIVYGTQIEIQRFKFRLDNKWYLSWDGFASTDTNAIEINPVLGSSMKLAPGQSVQCDFEQFDIASSIVNEVYVKPLSSDDWEIAEQNSNFLQGEILNQTKLVHMNGIIVCYVGNSVCRFSIEKIVPPNLTVGTLGDGSLIIVEPKENELKKAQLKSQKDEKIISIKRELYWDVNSTDDATGKYSMHIFLKPEEVKGEFAIISVIENKIEKNSGSSNKVSKEKPIKIAKEIVVGVLPMPEDQPMIENSSVILSYGARNSLATPSDASLNNGRKIKVEFIQSLNTSSPSHLQMILHFVGDNTQHKSDILDNIDYLTNYQSFQEEMLVVELLGENGAHIPFLDMRDIDPATIEIIKKSNSVLPWVKKDVINSDTERIEQFVKANKTLDEIVDYLNAPLIASPACVIEGPLGVGKTTMLQQVMHELTKYSNKNVRYFNCETIPDNLNYEKMKKFICDQLVSLSYWYQPSVILLDNTEFIFGKVADPEGGASSSSARRGNNISNKLSLLLIHEVSRLVSRQSNCIKLVLATTRGDILNTYLYEKHFISKKWSLKPPTKPERCKFLDTFITHNQIALDGRLSTNDIAMDTEGYSVLDLQNLVERLLYTHLTSDQESVTRAQFTQVNNAFTPLFLQGSKSTSVDSDNPATSQSTWDQIGGLSDAKRMLLETLEWPVKYAPIFKQSPLRLRSGLLIYGYPGCGKTMLANTVARACGGLNFIPVKGPEILNKYIGASEQNVRELFERAQAIKPCVLFFDEFDSVATKRGHDSTGVTDRVVNQLLTQMDGAEGLDGVYVVAATSRPDLIDPALLRPGRLDKSVFCDVPSAADRMDILLRIFGDETNAIELDPSVTNAREVLSDIVTLTDGCSGADLQGVCYNAYLKAVHRSLETPGEDKNSKATGNSSNDVRYTVLNGTVADGDVAVASGPKETPGVRQEVHVLVENLQQACQETRPSISAHERAKLSAVYASFQGSSREADLRDGEAPGEIGSRLSLA